MVPVSFVVGSAFSLGLLFLLLGRACAGAPEKRRRRAAVAARASIAAMAEQQCSATVGSLTER